MSEKLNMNYIIYFCATMYLRIINTAINDDYVKDFSLSFSTVLFIFLSAFFIMMSHYYGWIDRAIDRIERIIGPIEVPQEKGLMVWEVV
jgi:glucan phosphoethanolaminetransferase (alkaline phosphatase superfamily)